MVPAISKSRSAFAQRCQSKSARRLEALSMQFTGFNHGFFTGKLDWVILELA
jgi:hypothetical protein